MSCSIYKLDEIIQKAIDGVIKLSGVDNGYLLKVGINFNILDLWPCWMNMLHNGEVINIPKVSELPLELGLTILNNRGIQSIVIVPILVHGRLHGVIIFESINKQRSWSDSELALLNAVVDIVEMYLNGYEVFDVLTHKEQLLNFLLRNSFDFIWVLGAGHEIIYIGDTGEDLIGCPIKDFKGTPYIQHVHPDDAHAIQDALSNNNGKVFILEHRIRHADGRWLWVEAKISNHINNPLINGLIINMHDITLRKKAEDDLLYQIRHDPLTGLYNRSVLMEKIKADRLNAINNKAPIALLFIDLDHFNTVNDSMGHDGGTFY